MLKKTTAPLVMTLLVGAFAACAPASQATSATSSSATLNVVTTSNVVGDWARVVAGSQASVYSLIPAGLDPHTYQPSAQDVTKVADADVVLTVGLGLEHRWLEKLLQNASADASKIVALGDGVDPIPFEGEHHDEHGEGTPEEEEEESPWDPHFWTDPLRAEVAVNAIADRLASVDAANASIYRANASAYTQKLDELDAWIKTQVSHLTIERRALITSHDTLGYFAHRYEFEVVGVIIPGGATEADPSAADIALLEDKIKEHNAMAIFSENTVSDKMAQRIAQDTGVKVVRSLYSDSLGPAGSPGDTYLGMIRSNVTAIVEALR